MNDERVGKILDWLTDRITKAEGFVLEQAPDVIQQIITMDVITSAVWLLAFVVSVFAIMSAYRLVWVSSSKWKDEQDRVMARGILGFIAGLFLIALAVGITISLATIAKAKYAPKAYLLERVGVLK